MIPDEQRAILNAPPQVSVSDSTAGRFYSPWQICVGALLGGPLAGGYFYSRDHISFGSPNKARTSLLWTGVVVICLFAIGLSSPRQSSGTVLAAAVAGMYRWFARQAFDETISTRRNQGWTQYSWWRVVGLSVVGLILTLAILFLLVSFLPDQWTSNLQ